MEMRLLACVTRGLSREPYQTISMVYFNLGILRTELWSQGSPGLVDFAIYWTSELCSEFAQKATVVFVLCCFVSFFFGGGVGGGNQITEVL